MVCLFPACSDSPDPDPVADAGWLEARWTGADSGKLAARATAEWCGRSGLLEIRAVQGDTGVAMVLYPWDTIEAGTYRVVPPDRADTAVPSAGLALRVFATNAVQGYQGDSGAVVLERSGSGELSGTLDARARSVVNGKQVTLTGKMRGLTVVSQTRGCAPAPAADTADTSDGSGTEVD